MGKQHLLPQIGRMASFDLRSEFHSGLSQCPCGSAFMAPCSNIQGHFLPSCHLFDRNLFSLGRYLFYIAVKVKDLSSSSVSSSSSTGGALSSLVLSMITSLNLERPLVLWTSMPCLLHVGASFADKASPSCLRVGLWGFCPTFLSHAGALRSSGVACA